MYEVRIAPALVGEIIRRLVSAAEPERIILFGSRAQGHFRPDSDLDLLLVKECAGSTRDLEVRAYASLSGLAVPVDILCYTPEQVEKWSGVPNHVVARAVREGQVLYDKRL